MISWLTRWFRGSSPTASAAQGRITFGGTSVGRTISRTGLLLKKQLWIWPIIAVVLLAVIGYGIRAAIERTMKASLQSELQTLLNIERSMLETWLKVQESNAESLANDQQVRETDRADSRRARSRPLPPPGRRRPQPPAASPARGAARAAGARAEPRHVGPQFRRATSWPTSSSGSSRRPAPS